MTGSPKTGDKRKLSNIGDNDQDGNKSESRLALTPQRPEAKVKKYPYRAHAALIAPLIRADVAAYLETLDVVLSAVYVPSPPPAGLPAKCPRPTAILTKISSLHSADDLMAHHTLPVCPTWADDRVRPKWLEWEAKGFQLEAIKDFMQRARHEGVWALLWASEVDPLQIGVHEGDDDDDDEDDDEEDDEDGIKENNKDVVDSDVNEVADNGNHDKQEADKEDRRVSKRGGRLFRWLAALWCKDLKCHARDLGYSPAFLAQLPKVDGMQCNNASSVLAVVRSAVQLKPVPCVHEAANKLEVRRRQKRAGYLLYLLSEASQVHKGIPPFHGPSLTLAMVTLFREPMTRLTEFVHNVLIPCIARDKLCHFLIHAIEDLAVVGAARPGPRLPFASRLQDGQAPYVRFHPPTVSYTLECLLLPVADSRKQQELEFLRYVLALFMFNSYRKDEAWRTSLDSLWQTRLISVFEGVPNFYGAKILELSDTWAAHAHH